ncbi:aromatic acid exporter family protein [Glycomyces sp. TRM65418]|uniref:FUSC family protein n=1 Tax=Glycomyces sp. TRM65418 TaxID=2867006 RepID=UPI001CE6453D|nr:aromatic acid exporter family protein [Glycomyces sp. TRM65418]MCC3761781.1 aromatic acid exporter family protein [Glycomyces sp. TRM65418]QZD55865.1 FUSC family protein [Glycomyces sp. TRM65418]
MRRFLRDMARRGTWAQETATQALKAAIASVLAWIVAAHLLALPMPYLAAWAALVVVRPTVHWSVLTGLRQLVAVGLGVVVAVLAVVVTPGKELALAVGVSVAFLIGYWPRLNDQGLYVPFTALFMIAVDSVEEPFVVVRLLETALGAGIGMAVNLLIEPPARVRAVGTRIRQDGAATAEFLRQIAAWLREESERGDGDTWAGRAKRLDSHAAETRSALDHANDSLRLNPHTTSAQTDALDRFHAGFELNQRVLRATRALTDVLDGPARGAIPDDLALDAEFCGDCATVIEETVDVYEGRLTRILTRHDSDPGDSSSADEALTALERRTHAAGDDGVMVEMQATVLVALRRLLSEAQS